MDIDGRLTGLSGKRRTHTPLRPAKALMHKFNWLGFAAALNGHCYQGTDQDDRKQLAHNSFADGQRTRERIQRSDIATYSGKRAKTKIRQP
jgi:hypothetical protein